MKAKKSTRAAPRIRLTATIRRLDLRGGSGRQYRPDFTMIHKCGHITLKSAEFLCIR
jgi:hypothetical protein